MLLVVVFVLMAESLCICMYVYEWMQREEKRGKKESCGL